MGTRIEELILKLDLVPEIHLRLKARTRPPELPVTLRHWGKSFKQLLVSWLSIPGGVLLFLKN